MAKKSLREEIEEKVAEIEAADKRAEKLKIELAELYRIIALDYGTVEARITGGSAVTVKVGNMEVCFSKDEARHLAAWIRKHLGRDAEEIAEEVANKGKGGQG